MADSGFDVEVVYARPDTQVLVKVTVPPGATLLDAVRQSGLLQRFPELELEPLDAGIFSKPAVPDAVLRPGDRVEIYRPLLANPKEMRRRRAKKEGPAAGQ
jgi:putative ubiquitin-RnfH superfamily antitoxin RatB of RatAB toxin-antitoxin module